MENKIDTVANKRAKASSRAKTRLLAKYPADYQAFYVEECVKLGLNPKSDKLRLQLRVAELEAQLAKYQAETEASQ